ncbi:arsenical pump-driving ATPase [Evansella clarkii]|uniref:arsenical pump-driving ATPase n=1 Tax=Evansella clarkii TaxID=79879 RepID=UPI0009980DDE|nr:arsenical pump-driving ATPase [Evansella clarkii]
MFQEFSPEQIPKTPYLFFTGKGGTGKTSAACASAVALADQGKKVLIVSTDPASNLQDVFDMEIGENITAIPAVPGLSAVNLDPEAAAAAYRDKVVGPYRDRFPAAIVSQMEEQLSGACTVEIAAFDEFTTILTKEELTSQYDTIIFDTAPTGHTLRLLQLPNAWTDFLEESTHGASCLGPLSGLDEKKSLYESAVNALADEKKTTLLLVVRPDESSIREGGRAAAELAETGLENQMALMNGVFQPGDDTDESAAALFSKQQAAISKMEHLLEGMPVHQLPYVPYPLTGIGALRSFLQGDVSEVAGDAAEQEKPDLPGLGALVEKLAEKTKGVIMTMGKGGVGKTTIATAVAAGLAEKGKKVHLTTTDPAAHIEHVIKGGNIPGEISVSRIHPEKEVEHYKQEVLSKAQEELDEEGLAYLEEDLSSPCTEEIAVFRSFANAVEKADSEFVVIDTAPTGHTLLLLDASQSYHKEIERSSGEVPDSVVKLLPRLRNKEETDVIVVTLPEATPVLEASRLEEDLERAEITPSWWVINQSLAAADTTDPILKARGNHEVRWIREVWSRAENTVLIPWIKDEIQGADALRKLTSSSN